MKALPTPSPDSIFIRNGWSFAPAPVEAQDRKSNRRPAVFAGAAPGERSEPALFPGNTKSLVDEMAERRIIQSKADSIMVHLFESPANLLSAI
jgi:hypothetical protein